MHHVIVIVYPGFELLDTAGPATLFNSANRALVQQDRPTYYKAGLVSASGGAVESSSGGVETRSIANLKPGEAQTVLVAGAEREQFLPSMGDPVLRAALPGLAAKAERFGSVCSGGFLLVPLGLLDGHRIATHWDSCKPLAETFPAVTVDRDHFRPASRKAFWWSIPAKLVHIPTVTAPQITKNAGWHIIGGAGANG